MKIIIVDDEIHALQIFLSEIIGKSDVEYKFYCDDEASILAYAKENRIDAAFLDINMPSVNGIHLAKKLIQLDKNIKIVFITGLAVTTDDLDEEIEPYALGVIYKPYDFDTLNKYLNIIKNETPLLTVKTFASFDCFIGDKVVKFSSTKSKELFALLIAYNGKTLTMTDAISQLWPDTPVEKSKILYRDAVWRLRKTLVNIGAADCVEFQRAQLVLDKSHVKCDYWDFLSSKKGNYHGEFCKNYDWSIEYLPALDDVDRET